MSLHTVFMIHEKSNICQVKNYLHGTEPETIHAFLTTFHFHYLMLFDICLTFLSFKINIPLESGDAIVQYYYLSGLLASFLFYENTSIKTISYLLLQISPRHALLHRFDLLRRPARNDPSALLTAAGTHVDDVVGVSNHIQIMFDDEDGRTVFDQGLEYA